MPDDRGKPENPTGPGWYPDPWSADGKGERYFDGKRWGSTERHARGTPRSQSTNVDHAHPAGAGPASSSASRWSRPSSWGSSSYSAPRTAPTTCRRRLRAANPSPGAALRPPPGAESSAQPLGRPATPPPGTGGYEVLAHQPRDEKTPIAFDPCRPIHYVVNPDGTPADGAQLVDFAFESLSSATGLKFVNDGTTTEAPTKERRAYLPNRYSPNLWAPVLVAWSDEQSFPNLAGYLAGIGGPSTVYASSNTAVYVSGIVVLDRVQLSAEAEPERAVVRAVILHELGHLVGLDHTADRMQLMFSESQFNVRDYAEGDRRGLAVMGTQACVPEV